MHQRLPVKVRRGTRNAPVELVVPVHDETDRQGGTLAFGDFDGEQTLTVGGHVIVRRAVQVARKFIGEHLFRLADHETGRCLDGNPQNLLEALDEDLTAVSGPSRLSSSIGRDLAWRATCEWTHEDLRGWALEADVGQPSAIGGQIRLELDGVTGQQFFGRGFVAHA